MVQKRFYTEDNLQTDSFTELKDEEHHHLKNVMRVSLGEEIELINGKGYLAIATVESLEKKQTRLKIVKATFEKKQKELSIALALTKMQKLDFAIEKCTELGIDNFYLFDSMNSEKKGLSNQQEKRLKTLTISAIKQCGRLYLPKVEYHENFTDILNIEKKHYVCDFSKSSKPIKSITELKDALVIIGPEKGFSEKERLAYKKNGTEIIELHKNILRAETAAVVAATYLSQ